MKRLVGIIGCILAVGSMLAQVSNDEHAPNELVVQYTDEITPPEKQAVRNFFTIEANQTNELSDELDHWYDLVWPIVIVQGDDSFTIPDVIALRDAVDDIVAGEDLDDGNINGDEIEGYLNGADLNYLLYLLNTQQPGSPAPHILPQCSAERNNFLSYDGSQSPIAVDDIEVYLVDQAIGGDKDKPDPIPSFDNSHFEAYPADFNSGGKHGEQILSVIEQQLERANIDGVQFFSVNVFDADGVATYARLLDFIDAFGVTRKLQDEFPPEERTRAIVNLSASFIINPGDEDALILMELWASHLEDFNVLLSSSAGNYGLSQSNLVYPGCGGFANEVTVAGTQDCFYKPWLNSNANKQHFEIATEASVVLTEVDDIYDFAFGTSFSTALMTGGIVQLLAQCDDNTVIGMKDFLLTHSNRRDSLRDLVNKGKLLSVSKAMEVFWRNGVNTCSQEDDGTVEWGGGSGGGDTRVDMAVSPNPFSGRSVATFSTEMGDVVEVSLVRAATQTVVTRDRWVAGNTGEAQWELPTNLQAGTYVLHVLVDDERQQQFVIKQ